MFAGGAWSVGATAQPLDDGRIDLGRRQLSVEDVLVVRPTVQIVSRRANQIESQFFETVKNLSELTFRLGHSGASVNEASFALSILLAKKPVNFRI